MRSVNLTAILAAWGVLVAGAAGVMKTTDGVRSFTEKHLPTIAFPSYTWIAVAFGAGIVATVTSHLNPLLTMVPQLPHLYGEVLSGIVMGAIASPLHHGTALLAAKSKAVAAADPVIAPDDTQAQIPAEAIANDPGDAGA